MVQKKGKGQIHSGNSLRKRPRCFKPYYNDYSAIVKRVINCNASANTDETLQTGIEYSLNKKNRWMLVKKIKQEIIQKQSDCDTDIHLSLTKYHNLRQTSNCRLHVSSLKDREDVRPRPGHAYFNASSVVPIVDHFGMRTVRKKTMVNNRAVFEYETVPAEPEVKYEVYEPSPSKLLMEKSWITKMKTPHPTKHRKHKQIQLDDIYDDFYEDFSDEEYDQDTTSDSSLYPNNDTFDDNDSHKQDLLNMAKKYSSPKSFDTKAKVVVITQEDFHSYTQENPTPNQAQRATELRLETESIPRRVGIPVETMDPEFLQMVYGDRYREAGCVPRRFLINIQEEIVKFFKDRSWMPQQNLEAYVCFTCSDEWVAEEGVEIVRITFITNLKVTPVFIETLCEFEMYTPLDIVESVMKYLTTLPRSCFELKHGSLRSSTYNRFTNYDMVNAAYDSKICSKTPEQLCKDNDHHANFLVGAKYSVPVKKDEVCIICYSAMLEGSNSTALASCLHWFCNDCWQHHLVTKIRNGVGKLVCPEPGCKAEVDYTTLVSLIPFRLAHVYLHQQVESQEMWRWCPYPRCGKVLVNHGSKADSLDVKCHCGTVSCFKCLGAAHWPATCDMAAKYSEKRIANGDDIKILNSLTSHHLTLQIKRCPKCGNGIEKNGGCPFMYCRCNHGFCWRCLKPYTATHHGGRGCNGSAGFEKNIDFEDLNSARHLRSSADYFHAIEHRKSQHPLAVNRLRHKAVEIAKHLKPHLMCNTINDPAAAILKIYEDKFSHEDDIEKPATNPARNETPLEQECRKTIENQKYMHRFLQRTLDFSVQLHHVAEHLGILIKSYRHSYSQATPKFTEFLNILVFASFTIDQIFDSGKDQDMKYVIPRLQRLVCSGGECLKNLAMFRKSFTN